MKSFLAKPLNIENFTSCIQHVPLAIALFDRNMRYIATSTRWHTEAILSTDSLIGQHHYDVVPFLPSRWRHGHTLCLTEGISLKQEKDLLILPSDGQEWLNWEIHPWFDHALNIAGLYMHINKVPMEEVNGSHLATLLASLHHFSPFLNHAFKHDLPEVQQEIHKISKEILHLSGLSEITSFPLDHFQIIKNNITKLDSLIESISLYYQAANHPLEKEKINLKHLTQKTIERHFLTLKHKTIIFQHKGKQDLSMDPLLAAEIIRQILKNSIQYNAHSKIIFNVQVEEISQGHILTFSDNGYGIPPPYHSKIFEPFYRLFTDQQHHGVGLGLAICQKSVERHLGEIWLDKNSSKGAHIKIFLPH